MPFTLSEDQLSIVNSRNQNVLVSAAAGSGKTSVLTERIVGLVCDDRNPINIDRVLVVTFTNAAAKEMKERIRNSLEDRLLKNPSNSHLQKQVTLIHGSLITTIDSFCLYVVRNHFSKIGLDPAFRVASETEMKLLKEEVLKNVIKRAYASGNPEFYHVVDCYSKKDNDDSLENAVLKIFSYSMSYPYPRLWLEKRRSDYELASDIPFEKTEMGIEIKEAIINDFEEMLSLIETARRYCLMPAGPYTYETAIDNDFEDITSMMELAKNGSLEELSERICNYKFKTLSGKCECDENIKAIVKDKIRDRYKKILSEIKENYFYQPLEGSIEDLRASGRVINTLIDLVEDFSDSFEKEKRERGLIDFSDMEHLTVQILIKEFHEDGLYEITDVAKGYRDFFEEVMVDEYQDSNLVQELIIQSVSREFGDGKRNRFMVGDVKQSIYRFRLARPDIFMGKMDGYEKNEASENRLITLKKNYRSRKSVIDGVNAVFDTVMGRECGGVDYDEDARLYFGGDFPEDTSDNQTEIMLVQSKEKSSDSREAQIHEIAKRILELKREMKVCNKDKSMRKASFGDIAILFRSPSKWKDAVKDIFNEYNIPYHLEGTGSFFDATEISDVISFLKILNNPLDDVAMYASMTSFFGKFTDEECARIRALSSSADRFLYGRVKSYHDNYPDDKKVSAFLEMLGKYRKLATFLPIHELISTLFEESGYKDAVSALPDGNQRLANVNLLVMKACEYAKTSFYGLFHFIRYVELIKSSDDGEGEANTFDENADVVKIMSIHKSKGLEFPIVFVAGIDESFSDTDLKAAFVTDMESGIGASFIDPVKRVKRSTLKKKLIIRKSRRENISEEVRILYVAMTRAKEKLIMTGCCDNPEEWIMSGPSFTNTSYMSMLSRAVCDGKEDVFAINACNLRDNAVFEAADEISRAEMRSRFEKESDNADTNLVESIRERFSFEYPYERLRSLYTKTTVSDLKMAAIEKEDGEAAHPFKENEKIEYVPSFAGGENEVKGTDRGTAYHNLLELLDFKAFPDCEDIAKEYDRQIEKLILNGRIPKEDAEKVFKSKIVAFLNSETARQMMEADKAGNLYKEQPFVIGVKADTIDETFPDFETVLVQGVIDVYYIHEGRVTVLDYKTDRVETGEELVKRYRKQLEYYAEALRTLTGLETDELLLYSFGLNSVFVIK